MSSKKYHNLAWLERYGRFISAIWYTVHGETRVTWRANGGIEIVGYGDNIESMYDDIFIRVKETLYAACVDYVI